MQVVAITHVEGAEEDAVEAEDELVGVETDALRVYDT